MWTTGTTGVEQVTDYKLGIYHFHSHYQYQSIGYIAKAYLWASLPELACRIDYQIGQVYQRWSPRGRPWPRGNILKSLAAKVKSLALTSKPQVLENCPVLYLRTALFCEWLKLCRSAEKKFWRPFFGEHLRLCPWPRAFLSLASRGSALGRAILGLGLGFFLCPWPWPRALCPRLHLWSLVLGPPCAGKPNSTLGLNC